MRRVAVGSLVAILAARGVAAPPPPVLVLAVDGLSHPRVLELAAKGEVPFLARLGSDGRCLVLRSDEPMLSPRLWNTIATGLPPAAHGVTGFTFRRAGSYDSVLANALNRRVAPFWELAGTGGARVAVVNWLTTYPVSPVNGTLISGDFVARWKPAPRATYPEDAGPRLVPRIDAMTELAREATLASRIVTAAASPDDARMLADYVARDRRAALMAMTLAREARPALLTVYFAGVDIAGHLAWEGDRGGARVDGYYAYVDRLCEAVASALPRDARILVVSDHGFRARREGSPPEVDANRILEALGYLAMGPRGIDFPRTSLFNLDERYSPEKPIFANVSGREPQGAVPPSRLETVLEQARLDLAGLRTERGTPVFSRVERGSRSAAGPIVAPELVATVDEGLRRSDRIRMPARGRTPARALAVADLGFSSADAPSEHDALGVLLFSRGLSASVREAGLRDVAPTVLGLLGRQPPAALEGRAVLAAGP